MFQLHPPAAGEGRKGRVARRESLNRQAYGYESLNHLRKILMEMNHRQTLISCQPVGVHEHS